MMGLFDWFLRKRGPKTASEGRDRPDMDRTGTDGRSFEDRIDDSRDGRDLERKKLEKQLDIERRRSKEQERRLAQMESAFNKLQAQWSEMMDAQRKALLEISSKGKGPEQRTGALEGQKRGQPAGQDRISSVVMSDKRFEDFVVDDTNRFAYLAAEAIANGDSKRYNPLFIYGPVGVGKTHLMQAIANRMMERRPGIKLLYSSTERFTDELIKALEKGEIESFRSRYRDIDVLLIDDIQMLSGRETTQKEFFHMFNHLHSSQRQIVLCSDRPPSEIQELEGRLRSRFEGGLTIDIQVPTFEGRRQILVNQAQRDGFSISTEVLDYLAFYLDSSVRELEGGFNRVTAYASLMKEPITVNLARRVLEGILSRKDLMHKQWKEPESKRPVVEISQKAKEPQIKDLELEEETSMLERELLKELKRSPESI